MCVSLRQHAQHEAHQVKEGAEKGRGSICHRAHHKTQHEVSCQHTHTQKGAIRAVKLVNTMIGTPGVKSEVCKTTTAFPHVLNSPC